MDFDRKLKPVGVRARLLASTALAALIAGAMPAAAQNATWNDPATVPGPVLVTFDFNANANWNTPATVPTGTAFFGATTTPDLSFSANTTIGGWTFNPGASAYTFTFTNPVGLLEFTGTGITINGGSASITNDRAITFRNTSTAGSATITNNSGLAFIDTSTAGSATIANNAFLIFLNTSRAGSATITNSNGGTTLFNNTSSGGTARLIANGTGLVDFSGLNSAGTTAGSFEGSGNFYLGSKTITVGGNNLSTEVSGVIQDGGFSGGVGGALVKAGTGVLALSGANTYTGSTTVNAGALIVDGSIASSSGLTVGAGALVGGTGTLPSTTINGTLSPGNSIGIITVNGNLAFGAGSAYLVEVSPAAADRTNVTGTAALGGTVLAIFAPGSYITKQYTILHANGGVGGAFAGLSGNIPVNFSANLSYGATDVLLNLTAALGQPPQQQGQGQQQNRGKSLGLIRTSGTSPAPSTISSTMAGRCRPISSACSG